MPVSPHTFYQKVGKRLLDLAIAVPALILVSPLYVLVLVLVRIKLGSPVLFCQKRPGLKGRPFTLIKFRTMLDAHDASGNVLPDEQRLTSFGRFLRSTSLDELPELINVIGGEMSVVGPRPLLMEYLSRYSPTQARRHDVKPGITGWAQVNGRNSITWKQKFEHDVWYVENQSFGVDLKIIARTLYKVLKRDDINQDGQATVEYFQGNQTTMGE